MAIREVIRRDKAIRDLAGKHYLRSSDGGFIIDMMNRILSIGIGAEIYFNADAKTIRVGGATGDIIIDGANKKITAGTGTYKITIDGANSRIEVGETKILIDGGNRRILVNDGTNDRILIGYQSGGF